MVFAQGRFAIAFHVVRAWLALVESVVAERRPLHRGRRRKNLPLPLSVILLIDSSDRPTFLGLVRRRPGLSKKSILALGAGAIPN